LYQPVNDTYSNNHEDIFERTNYPTIHVRMSSDMNGPAINVGEDFRLVNASLSFGSLVLELVALFFKTKIGLILEFTEANEH